LKPRLWRERLIYRKDPVGKKIKDKNQLSEEKEGGGKIGVKAFADFLAGLKGEFLSRGMTKT